jgi:hypothetical protein
MISQFQLCQAYKEKLEQHAKAFESDISRWDDFSF